MIRLDGGVPPHLWVLAAYVSVHGGARGHLSATQVAGLGLHPLVGQVHVLLQHVLRQVLLIARGTRPRLAHCGRRGGRGRGHVGGGNKEHLRL